MKEGALKWSLRLLGILLFIAPFLIALGMHNWDIQAAVMPSEAEMGQIQDSIGGIFSGTPIEDFTFSNLTYDINTGSISMDVSFKSNIDLSLTITDFSGNMTCGDHPGVVLAQIQMEEESVEVLANGTANITIVGQPTTEGIQHIMNVHGGDISTITPGFENASITIEFYGLSIQIQMSESMGGP